MDHHLRGVLSISWNKTALYICLCYVTIRPQVLHKTSYMIFLSPIYIFLKSCSKGPILTIFLGRTDRHLHGVLSISRDETAFYICLRYVTMCRQIYHRKMLIIFLSPIYISSQLLLRRPNIDYFSRSRGSSLTRRFGYCLGRNGAANTFVQRHDVSSYFQRTVLTVFLSPR